MKKVIRYMQNQAVQYSEGKYDGSLYLTTRGGEPQQRRSNYNSQHSAHAELRSSLPSSYSYSSPHHSSDSLGTFSIPYTVNEVQYAQDNILQSYQVFIPEPTPDLIEKNASANGTPVGSGWATPKAKYWVVYIHGGYFRDPKVTASTFHPALAHLLNPSHSDSSVRAVQSHIAGYASINYRLAPHEGHPQDEDTPKYERREARWPEMMDDVLHAIKHLQQKHGFGERYLLVGHSVGATLALLACLKARDAAVEPPIAVAGVCGIYDFRRLHHKYPGYDHLTRNAIKDEREWVRASPGRYKREMYEDSWAKGRKRWVLLAHSRRDGLVDWGQAEAMSRVFQGDDNGLILEDLMEIKGRHDEVWEEGAELVRVVAAGVGEMMSLDQ